MKNNLIVGLVTGLVGGLIVYKIYANREAKKQSTIVQTDNTMVALTSSNNGYSALSQEYDIVIPIATNFPSPNARRKADKLNKGRFAINESRLKSPKYI